LDEHTVADVEGKRGERAGLGVHDGLGVVAAACCVGRRMKRDDGEECWMEGKGTYVAFPDEFGVLNPSACCILDS
jgi:hypothetical protein